MFAIALGSYLERGISIRLPVSASVRILHVLAGVPLLMASYSKQSSAEGLAANKTQALVLW